MCSLMSEKSTQTQIFPKLISHGTLAHLGLTFNVQLNTDRNEEIPSTIKEWMEIGLFVVYFIDLCEVGMCFLCNFSLQTNKVHFNPPFLYFSFSSGETNWQNYKCGSR